MLLTNKILGQFFGELQFEGESEYDNGVRIRQGVLLKTQDTAWLFVEVAGDIYCKKYYVAARFEV